jgi:hypothetical protein
MTVMTGWLGEGQSGALSLVDNGIALTDCDRKGSAVVQPMAVLDFGPRLVVFTIDYDYENETYSVFNVSPAAVARAMSVDGGGC